MSTPTKDSKYSRKYAKEGVYPESARATSAHAISGNIATQYPWYGEFSSGPEPSDPVKRAYQLYMQQSEFKKPYMPGGYTEMETNADPPPGIQIPGYDGPGIPSVDEPIPPPDLEDGGTVTSFYVQVDRGYEYGGFCRGNTVNIRLFCQQPAYGYTVTNAEAGTSVNYITGFGTNELYLQVVADNNEFDHFTINVEMRSYEGVNGTSGVSVREVVCDEYYVVRMEYGLIDVVTVFSSVEGDVAVNIPDNAGTGVVTFPALFTDITNWLDNSTDITDQALLSVDSSPSWQDDSLTITGPQFQNIIPANRCSATYNAYIGGSWPHVDEDTSVSSGANGIGCNSTSGTIDDYFEWSAELSVDCPGGAIKDDPYTQVSYYKAERSKVAQGVSAEYNSLNLTTAKLVSYTECTGYSYWYFEESADHTQIPDEPPPGQTKNTDDGGGTSEAEVDYNWTVYSFLDDTNPLLSYRHRIKNEESWNDTFGLDVVVTGFSRTLTIPDCVPSANYSGVTGGVVSIQWYGNLYGSKTATAWVMQEVLQIRATDLSDQTGDIGGVYMNDWEDKAVLSVVDLPVLRGVHAAIEYIEDGSADNVDVCSMTRDSNLEAALEALFVFFKTTAGLATSDLIPSGVSISNSLRF